MKTTVLVLLVAAAFAAVAWVSLPSKDSDSRSTVDREYADYAAATAKETSWASVELLWEAPPEIKAGLRVKKAARLTLVGGDVLAGSTLVPRADVRAFLDGRVASGEIDCVVLFPSKGTRWKDIVTMLDECRKSRVRVVYLNQEET